MTLATYKIQLRCNQHIKKRKNIVKSFTYVVVFSFFPLEKLFYLNWMRNATCGDLTLINNVVCYYLLKPILTTTCSSLFSKVDCLSVISLCWFDLIIKNNISKILQFATKWINYWTSAYLTCLFCMSQVW